MKGGLRMSRVKKSTGKSTSTLRSDGSVPRHSGVTRWVTTLAVCVLAAFLFAPPGAVAQQQSPQPRVETEVTHQSNDSPSGPPYSVLREDPFPYRSLSRELQNKTTGTFTVVATGDLFWKFPVAKRMSPELRELLRSADTTVGNLEGGMMNPFAQER